MQAPRTHEVDVIRLFALLGICIVNVSIMGEFETIEDAPYLSDYDDYVSFLTSIFVQGKFITLFSFILGWGIAVQEKRINEAGQSFAAYYFRRILGLTVLGFFHMVFVFYGDVLLDYAVLCVMFWFMRSYVLRTSLSTMIRRFVILSYLVLLVGASILTSIGELDSVFYYLGDVDALMGSFYEASQFRLFEGGVSLGQSTLLFSVETLAAFSFGYLAAYKDFFKEGSEGFKKLKTWVPVLLLVGAALMAVYEVFSDDPVESLWFIGGFLLLFCANPMMSAAYLYFIVIFARRVEVPEVLVLAGRNSLSVYVLQGVIASLIFCGYGLGYVNDFGSLGLLLISFAIYLVTVFTVGLYAKRFGRGMLEPVLRKMSGTHAQPSSSFTP